MQALARPSPNMKRGVRHTSLPQAMELSAVVSFWEREGTVFSKSTAPGKLTTLQWKPIHSRTCGQCKLVSRNLRARRLQKTTYQKDYRANHKNTGSLRTVVFTEGARQGECET